MTVLSGTEPLLGAPLGQETADIETSSDGYASRFAGPVGEYFLDIQSEITLRLLAPWPGARVLEVGGGHAQLAPPLLANGYRVTVAGSAEVCRERLDRALPAGSFEFRACDLLRLPFPDRSFDAVLSFRLLAHAERWQELVAELCRVADKAVIVDYSDTRSFNSFYGPLFHWKRRLEGNTRTFITFRPGDVPGAFARCGFGRLTAERELFVPMVVHRALGKAGFSRAAERAGAALGLTRALGSPVILRAQREDLPT